MMPIAPATTAEELHRARADAEPHARPHRRGRNIMLDALLVAIGCALTLAVHGYRFGEGNHTVYLLDALRRTNPELLRNDWFTTQTLQYHAAFGWVAQKLIVWNVIEPAFRVGYVLLVIVFHVAWFGIARRVGGDRAGYLLSLVLYYASGAGTGLGMYQFFQDSSFLPSNVANVAMLWGVLLWIAGRPVASGAALGVAGLFHLNHAVVGCVGWVVLCLADAYFTRETALSPTLPPPAAREPSSTGRGRRIAIGSVLALGASMINIVFAAIAKFERGGSMSLAEFVELYVRLRHPHHYDPSSWPVALWFSVLWPLPVALFVLWKRTDDAGRRARHVLIFMLTLQAAALLGAGVWYVSESLVQMSLYRFSIFVQLLSCVVVAGAVVSHFPRRRTIALVASVLCAAMVTVCMVRGPFFGAFVMPADDPEYLAVCDWARDNTPVDAIFLVPPGESAFRLRARRAIVVNFKAVPQLSGELPEWRERLRTTVALDNLSTLPRGYPKTLRAIDARYAALSDVQLVLISLLYDARFVVTRLRLPTGAGVQLAFSSPKQTFFVYDLGGPIDWEEIGNE